MSIDGPLVTVVVPAYNAVATIDETLASVVAQTYRSIEVIVVDDGSSDGTYTAAQVWAQRDARVQVVRQENAGVGAARNRAIAIARGEYLAPVDADDTWAPEKLSRQVWAAEEAGPTVSVVYCWSSVVDRDGVPTGTGPRFLLAGRVLPALVFRNFVGNASVPLIRRAALDSDKEAYLTRESQAGAQGCEDWDLCLRLAERSSFAVLPAALVNYRQAQGCMSFDVRSMARSYETVMRRARQRNPDLPPRLFRWSASRFYQYYGERCFRSGRYADYRWAVRRAIAADPAVLLNTGIIRKLGTCLWQRAERNSSIRPSAAGLAIASGKRRSQLWTNRLYGNLERSRWERLVAGVTPNSAIGEAAC